MNLGLLAQFFLDSRKIELYFVGLLVESLLLDRSGKVGVQQARLLDFKFALAPDKQLVTSLAILALVGQRRPKGLAEPLG